ncbi:hypothetical protein [uncultured Algimonas sp.]|uniref:hypothetical protein n=1 Tax=uncultured Algimonas sp. TaxID=1547920 RepID=UPI002636775A|nr:hypothetical protein [uncultured Algimonas sp.]
MKFVLTMSAALFLSGCATSNIADPEQQSARCDDIWTINSVTALPDRTSEAKRYYEAAWLPARRVAKEKGVIKDFHLLSTQKPDQPGFQLVTVYEDADQFAASEEAFQSIFRAMELPRPLLIDGLERAQIIADTSGADDYRFVVSPAGPCRP